MAVPVEPSSPEAVQERSTVPSDNPVDATRLVIAAGGVVSALATALGLLESPARLGTSSRARTAK